MKKLLGIVVLGLLFCNISFSNIEYKKQIKLLCYNSVSDIQKKRFPEFSQDYVIVLKDKTVKIAIIESSEVLKFDITWNNEAFIRGVSQRDQDDLFQITLNRFVGTFMVLRINEKDYEVAKTTEVAGSGEYSGTCFNQKF